MYDIRCLFASSDCTIFIRVTTVGHPAPPTLTQSTHAQVHDTNV